MTSTPRAAGTADDPAIQAVATLAVASIQDGARIGLGSGRAATAFITKLGERCRAGLKVSGVATSRASEAAARQAGIPLIELGTGGPLDLTVDGADEVSPELDLVKGWGGALVRERIVAAASREQVILVGPDKLVRALGERGRIPVEVIPLADWQVERELRTLGVVPILRMDAGRGQAYVTDNGNHIFDCVPARPLRDGQDARALERTLRAIVGVVDTGFFLGTASRVLVGHPDGKVDTMVRQGR
ncbi:MAG: ribose-5-phosphate isomerase RpiA [Gemmatimonadales bacterium]